MLLNVLDVKTEYKNMLKDLKELQKRLEGMTNTMWETISHLIRKASITILHRSSVQIIMDRMKAGLASKNKAQQAIGETAQRLLKVGLAVHGQPCH